jgi:hypothetical protein
MLDAEMDVQECKPAAACGRPRRNDREALLEPSRLRSRLWPLAGLVVLVMTTTVPTALATEPTSGYGGTTTTSTTTTPPPPTSTTTTPPPPTTGEEPARPETNEHPETTRSSPSEETTRPEEVTRPEEPVEHVAPVARKPHRTLPFTGLDIRLELALGVLLIAAGYPLLRLQRRRGSGRAQRLPPEP